MRKMLDWLYTAAGWLAAACLAFIAAMVAAQLLGRIADGTLKLLGQKPYGFIVYGLDEIAGYLLAVSSLLALAATLKGGVHIRVTMMLGAVGEGPRKLLEIIAFLASIAASVYLTHRLVLNAYDSWKFHEVSHGLVPVPLAWPQAAMALGAVIFTIALIDELLIVITQGRPSFRATEDAVTLGKEG